MDDRLLPKYFTILQARDRYANTLSPLARLIYGDIVVLSRNKEEVCSAQDSFFMRCFGRQKSTIKRCIKELKAHGFIETIGRGKGRKIKISKTR